MFVKLTILMCPNAININVALVFLLLILVTTSSLYLDKFSTVENLYKIEYKTDYDVLTILNRKIVIGSLETKGATASKTLIANGFSFKNSIVMATAKKDNCSVAVIHSGDNLDFSTLDATSGNVQNGICKVDFFILLRN